ncbi:MAG: LamG-like jellyroll fold domain-containing protein, partial [Nanoarchaeota archaeon]
MVYKKYVNKRGKIFGPYYYRSYREGDSVKKVYIGGEKEFGVYLRNKKKVEQPLKPLQPLNRTKVVRGIYLLLLFFLIFGIIFLLSDDLKFKLNEDSYSTIFNSVKSSRNFISGYAVDEIYNEGASNFYDGLIIKDPPKMGDSFLSDNKNKRMDFDINGGLRLYFDLLNYSDYIEKTGEKLIEKELISKEEILDNPSVNPELIENESNGFVTSSDIQDYDISIDNINVDKIKERIDNLDEDELREIEDKAVIEAEDFDVKVDKAKADDLGVDYKWGYKVKLNELNFISKLDITSDNEISIIDNSNLKIGNNILSFKDLVEEGYKIKINRPGLDFENIKEKKEIKKEINKTEIKKIKEESNLTDIISGGDNKSKDEGENDSEILDESEIRDIELIETPGLNKNFSDKNESGVSGSVVKDIENKSDIKSEENTTEGKNESKFEDINQSEIVEEPKLIEKKIGEKESNDSNEVKSDEGKKEVAEDNKSEASIEDKSIVEGSIVVVEEDKNTENGKDNEIKEINEEDYVESKKENENFGITGNVIRGITGFAVNGIENNLEVEDLKYKNSVSVYIERDFRETNYKIGDILYLDPTLVSINITDSSVIVNLESVVAENNFTHLTINNVGPYDRLVLYTPFDENVSSTRVYDFTNLNNNGNISNNPIYNSSCLYGGCYQFDGINDGLNISDNESLDISENVSISVWVFPRQIVNEPVVSKYVDSGFLDVTGYELSLVNTGGVIFSIGDGAQESSVSTNSSSIVLNKWNHIAGTAGSHISDSNISIYVNGVIVVSEVGAIFGGLGTNDLQLKIGVNNSDYFNGSIEEVMVFNTSLSAQQILDIYNNQSKRFKSTGNHTLKQSNISLTNEGRVNVSASFNNNFSSNVSLRIGQWQLGLAYNDSINGSVNNNTDSLKLYYHLDNRSNIGENDTHVFDFSGNQYNGTWNGSLTGGFGFITRGVYNGSFDFDGIDDYIETSNIIVEEKDDFTFSTWYTPRQSSPSTANVILVRGLDGAGTGWSVTIRHEASGNFSGNVVTTSPATTQYIVNGVNNASAGRTYHLAVTLKQSNSLEFFVDGVSQGTNTAVGSNLRNSTRGVRVADFENSADLRANGSIDEVMIFNRSLNASEINELYIKGRAKWNYTSPLNFTGGNQNTTFTVANTTENILPEYHLIAGNDTFNTFYSPLLLSSLIFDFFKASNFFNISGVVFNDSDYDGKWDTGEVGLVNITLRAWNDTDGDGAVDSGELVNNFTRTNTTGGYHLLVNSSYAIIQVSDLNNTLLYYKNTTQYSWSFSADNSTTNFGFYYNTSAIGNGSVKTNTKISDSLAGFNPDGLDSSDNFGSSITSIGDLDGDGIVDLAVGAINDENLDSDEGAIYILFMNNSNGTIKSNLKISDGLNGFNPSGMDSDEDFGISITSIGDLDGDGIIDLAVGAHSDENLASNTSEGAIYILFLNSTGGVKTNTKISDSLAGFNPSGLDSSDNFGSSITSIGDLDGDGIVDLAVGAINDENNNDGTVNTGAVYILFLNDTNGTVKRNTKITNNSVGFFPKLSNGTGHQFGRSITSIGDLNGDGIVDLAVGAINDGNLEDNEGALYILFLNDTNGTVKRNTKISDGLAGFNRTELSTDDIFGYSVSSVGDLDGDGIIDLAVGAAQDENFSSSNNNGVLYILFLNDTNGTIKNSTRIASTISGFNPSELENFDIFGYSVSSIGDLDRDGIRDLAVGAIQDENLASNSSEGAIYILNLNFVPAPDTTVPDISITSPANKTNSS